MGAVDVRTVVLVVHVAGGAVALLCAAVVMAAGSRQDWSTGWGTGYVGCVAVTAVTAVALTGPGATLPAGVRVVLLVVAVVTAAAAARGLQLARRPPRRARLGAACPAPSALGQRHVAGLCHRGGLPTGRGLGPGHHRRHAPHRAGLPAGPARPGLGMTHQRAPVKAPSDRPPPHQGATPRGAGHPDDRRRGRCVAAAPRRGRSGRRRSVHECAEVSVHVRGREETFVVTKPPFVQADV